VIIGRSYGPKVINDPKLKISITSIFDRTSRPYDFQW
jgi:hypothetical protein